MGNVVYGMQHRLRLDGKLEAASGCMSHWVCSCGREVLKVADRDRLLVLVRLVLRRLAPELDGPRHVTPD